MLELGPWSLSGSSKKKGERILSRPTLKTDTTAPI
jgi:hypothetical protein